MHRTLLENSWDEGIAGMVRTTQNWIGGNDWNPVGAAYVPPPPGEVPRLLDDLAVFVNRDNIPAILQAAVAHVQFELIHPFGDGNGRVGRCLIHTVLVRRGLVTSFVPPVSLVLAANARSYVAGLTAFRQGDPGAWISLFATAIRISAEEALRMAEDIAAQQRRWLERAGHPRRGSTAARLVERLAGSPIVDTAAVQAMMGVSHEAARTALLQLERAGVLRALSTSRYRRAWAAAEVFDLMDAVERRLASPVADLVAPPAGPAPRRRSPSRLGTHRQRDRAPQS
jgi:Fic family protein